MDEIYVTQTVAARPRSNENVNNVTEALWDGALIKCRTQSFSLVYHNYGTVLWGG